jgi:hypothetical protein
VQGGLLAERAAAVDLLAKEKEVISKNNNPQLLALHPRLAGVRAAAQPVQTGQGAHRVHHPPDPAPQQQQLENHRGGVPTGLCRLLASKDTFKDKIERFLGRIGLANHQKLFIMNSKDSHIREALLRRGWVERVGNNSWFFHLKWAYIDTPADYAHLQGNAP